MLRAVQFQFERQQHRAQRQRERVDGFERLVRGVAVVLLDGQLEQQPVGRPSAKTPVSGTRAPSSVRRQGEGSAFITGFLLGCGLRAGFGFVTSMAGFILLSGEASVGAEDIACEDAHLFGGKVGEFRVNR